MDCFLNLGRILQFLSKRDNTYLDPQYFKNLLFQDLDLFDQSSVEQVQQASQFKQTILSEYNKSMDSTEQIIVKLVKLVGETSEQNKRLSKEEFQNLIDFNDLWTYHRVVCVLNESQFESQLLKIEFKNLKKFRQIAKKLKYLYQNINERISIEIIKQDDQASGIFVQDEQQFDIFKSNRMVDYLDIDGVQCFQALRKLHLLPNLKCLYLTYISVRNFSCSLLIKTIQYFQDLRFLNLDMYGRGILLREEEDLSCLGQLTQLIRLGFRIRCQIYNQNYDFLLQLRYLGNLYIHHQQKSIIIYSYRLDIIQNQLFCNIIFQIKFLINLLFSQ